MGSRERGAVVSVVGPDGSGKTTLVDSLLADHLGDREVMRVRRPGILYRRTPEGIAVTEPHAQRPYSALLSLAKIAYLFCDELLGWAFRIKPFARRGGWVVIERGWWDLAVDPRRYRLRSHGGVLWWLGRLLPHPQLLLVLDAPAEVFAARKAELATEEVARQVRAWRERLPGWQRRVYLDAARPPAEVLGAAAAELRRLAPPSERIGANGDPAPLLDHGRRWVTVPPGNPRWVLPARPRRVAATGLAVYQPINYRARAGWTVARLLASAGMFRLLPGGGTPPPGVRDAMGPYLAAGDTLAVARTNHPGRWIALVIGPRGERRALGKVATDAAGRRRLDSEAEALDEYGGWLEAPLWAPKVAARGDGLLLFEVADYRSRLLPWRLPAEVARAAGRFARGLDGGAGGFVAHGDFAPWNLLRWGDRWVLLDWEYLRRQAPPFYDLWHYLVQSHVLLGRPSADAILAGARARGWVGEAIGAYAAGAGTAAHQCLDWLGAYLELSKSDIDASKPDGAAGLRAREALASKLR